MNGDQMWRVRSFNRAVTLSVGALQASYLARGRPLGEARLIFEVGAEGADVRVLRMRLGLDFGYMSRMLQSLVEPGTRRIAQGFPRRPAAPDRPDAEGPRGA